MDSHLAHFGRTHFAGADLGDRRRSERLVTLADTLIAHPEGSLPARLKSPADLEALYRLANEPDVTHPAVCAPHWRRTRQCVADHPDPVILCPHDDTDLNYTTRRSLHGDLGTLAGSGRQRGFVCHNSLAIRTDGEPLGILHQILHRNRPRKGKLTRARLRDDPNRLTRLWVRGREAIGDFPASKRVVDLLDRGGDTFEFYDFEARRGYHYVVRSKHDRDLHPHHRAIEAGEPTVKGLAHLRTQPEVDRRTLTVSPKPASGRQPAQPGRSAELAMAWSAVTLPAPSAGRARGQHGDQPLRLWMIRVWEVSPPAGSAGLEWFLSTNVEVKTPAEAWERVDWYERRWAGIEEFHKAMKTGSAIEGLQFRSGSALEPMIGLLSVVAWVLVYLKWTVRRPERAGRPAVEFVPERWVRVMSRWRHGEERPDWTLREWVMALARLGGHQGRPSTGDPGWQTLWKGWRCLQDFLRLDDG